MSMMRSASVDVNGGRSFGRSTSPSSDLNSSKSVDILIESPAPVLNVMGLVLAAACLTSCGTVPCVS